MSKVFWLIVLCVFSVRLIAQVDHWEAAVLPGNQWAYLTPSSPVPADWNTLSFDDETWEQGPGGIGYGDDDDLTTIPVSVSLFMRHTFTVADAGDIVSASFHMDYDDAFVAYLNGVEIARSNIGSPGTPPFFWEYAAGQHEAVMYDGGLPEEFNLNLEQLSLLNDGENILSVQVHNVNSTSSDMSSIPFLFLGLESEDVNYQELPEWFDPPESPCDPGLNAFHMDFTTGVYGEEISWELVDEEMNFILEGEDFESFSSYEYDLCLPAGCYELLLHDGYGDGWNGAVYEIQINGVLYAEGTLEQGYEGVLPVTVGQFCPYLGCTDSAALNFDPEANTDDGSCLIFGTSNLPIVVIDTYGQNIPDDPRITCHMGIIHNEDGVNSLGDPFNNYDGQITIERRGSTSQDLFPKKSYALETQLADSSNNNVSIIDMPAENDWILYASYSDKSLMRNVLTFGLGNAAGRYAPRTKMCELVIDGEYQGVYVMMESIKRDENRVDIATLLPEDIEGDELTGGYILKVDKFTGSGGDGWESNYLDQGQNEYPFIQYHRPKADDLTDEQKQYIENYVHQFEDILAGDDFDDPLLGYEQVIDVNSFIELSLINELSRNIDGYRLSTYFYKDKDSNGGKITMGPWWDYNLAFGNADYCSGQWTDGWEVESGCGANNPFWFERLKEDEDYANKMRCRWEKLRANEWSNESIEFFIDSVSDYVSGAAERNFARWPTLGIYVWPNWYTNSEVYQDEVDYLKDWVEQRLAWIDENLEGTCIQGCMDTAACNYDAGALCDDGSCEYVPLHEIIGELTPTLFETYAYTYDGPPESNYLWTSTGGVVVSGQGTPEVEVTWFVAGMVELSVLEITAEGCLGQQVDLNVNASGPTDISTIDFSATAVYPNPSSGTFHVRFPGFSERVSLEIMDALGKQVFTREYYGTQSIDVDTALPGGAYVLTLISGEGTFTTKLIIQ